MAQPPKLSSVSPVMGSMEWLFLIILSVLWGGSFFFSKIALAEVSPFSLVLSRVCLAAGILFVYLKLSGKQVPTGLKVWSAFFGMGLINNVIPFSLLFWGQTQIASGLASVLNATTPIFTIIVAHFLTRDEQFTPLRVTGVVLGFCGVAVMLGLKSGSTNSDPPLAMLACLGAALSYGFAAVFGRRFHRMNIGPVRVAFGQLTASTVLMIPIVLLVDPRINPGDLSVTTISSVLILAIFCTALAYILFFRILAAGGATNISLVTLLVPVSAILLGTLFLDERLGTSDYLGMLLIGLGLLVIDGRLFRSRKQVN